MVSIPQRSLTLRDLYQQPDDAHRYELSRGQVVREPPPGARHGRIVMKLGFLLEEWSRECGAGVVLAGDVGFILSRDPDTVRAPDLAVLTRAGAADLETHPGPVDGPPDVAIEVLSPGDRPGAVRAKLDDYRHAGTPLVWVIDPELQRVTEYRFVGGPEVFGLADTLAAPDMLPGFSAPVSQVFRRG